MSKKSKQVTTEREEVQMLNGATVYNVDIVFRTAPASHNPIANAVEFRRSQELEQVTVSVLVPFDKVIEANQTPNYPIRSRDEIVKSEETAMTSLAVYALNLATTHFEESVSGVIIEFAYCQSTEPHPNPFILTPQ